jgi:hypothetical protein
MNNFSLHASNGCSLHEKNLNGGKKKKEIQTLTMAHNL